jgi:exodeoxyribonuclease VII large subunit
VYFNPLHNFSFKNTFSGKHLTSAQPVGSAGGYNGSTMHRSDEERVYTVAEVNRLADGLLQDLVVWVEGEVSNLRPYPNFTFFSLTEEDAALPCVMFKDAMGRIEFELTEGMSLLSRGRLGIYVRRGQFRLNVFEAQEAGEGKLRREFLRLMRKLSKEGLFEESIKRPIPSYPELVGLVTSLEGAAVRDVVINLTRRFPGSRLVIRGVRVQGEEAAGEIIAALELFNRSFPVDVLILARGGGSLEDLQPFNTEEIVRAIRASAIPVITGVGHEPDITLSDLAADFRASTPTGAAEAAVPSCVEVLSLLRQREVSLAAELRKRLHGHERELGALEKRRLFSDPSLLVSQSMQYLAEGEKRLITATGASLQSKERGVGALSLSLARYPREYRELPARLEDAAAKLGTAVGAWMRWREREPGLRQGELRAAAQGLLARVEGRMKLAASRLEALSPLAVLARGYAIATRSGERRPLTDSIEVKEGEMLDVRLHRGKLYCEVRDRESADEEKD